MREYGNKAAAEEDREKSAFIEDINDDLEWIGRNWNPIVNVERK